MAQPIDKTARTREKKKKAKDLERELEEEKAKNATLTEALERSLQGNPDIEFNAENRMSSTRHTVPQSFQESKFVSSMNQLSVASINVPECKAPDGEEIHRQTYEMWKDLLVDSLKLAGIDDEATKFTVFKVKAGPRLLEIYRNTKSQAEAPDQDAYPFSNAMHRIKMYFGSGSDVMLTRRKLALMTQKPEETDLNFITRVGSTARLCEFDGEKEFEEIVSTVAEHARSREVRTTALKMLSRKGTFIDLVDKVREIETIRLNEEYVMRRHVNSDPAVVAPVQSVSGWDPSRQQRYSSNFAPRGARTGGFQRGNTGSRGIWRNNRGRQAYSGGNFRNQPFRSGPRSERCWRCGGVYHEAENCNAKDKNCNRCGRIGHIQRVCSYSETLKRTAPDTLDVVPNKIAAVERPEEELKEEQPEIKSNSLVHASTSASSILMSAGEVTTVPKPKHANLEYENLAVPSIDPNERSGFTSLKNVFFDGPTLDDPKSVHNLNSVHETTSMTKEFMPEGTIMAVVAGLQCSFLIDSGAEINTFTLNLFEQILSDPKYHNEVFNVNFETDRPLKAYATTGNIEVLATFHAYLQISNDRPTLLEKFYVVKERRALLGRATACRYSVLMLGLKVPIKAYIARKEQTLHAGEIAAICSSDVFPKFNVPPVKIYYDQTKPPCRNVFVNVPLAVKPMVEKRLQELVSADIIERVVDGMDTSFCSSMLVVPKGKDDIRLVIDLRGPNRYIHRNPFAMPTLEKILAELVGAVWFSTIDLANAFFHIELDEDSRHLTNFFTEYGMFRCVRLPFGLCNAPDVFQETLQRKILGDCKGCKNFLDDILIFGRSKEEHDANLAEVLARLANHNVKLNEDKCVFGSQSVKFLGFTLTPEGWQVNEEKVAAIKEFRRPMNCSEVKSFLGLITYVDKFIIHRAAKTEHLRALATSDVFYWTANEENEFVYLKDDALKHIKCLSYYSPDDSTELFVDASPTGLGAILVQYDKTNSPRIIACASKVLTHSEQRYPQTQKEALAIVWGVERFSFYLLGRTFVIRTDAEANQYIFNPCHRLGKRAVSRAESWALRLQPYDFVIQRVPGDENIADVLSRLVPETQNTEPFDTDDDKHFLYALDSGSMELTWNEIEVTAEEDKELKMVRDALKTKKWSSDLRSYEAQKKNLYCTGSLLFKDERVVLPKALRSKALQSAHGGHIGEMAMKRIMRQFFWWPKMSAEVTRFIKDCEICAMLSKRDPPVPLKSREMPDGPWEILQIDFLTVPHFGTGEFLVIVDTYSRYLAVVEMKAMDASSTNAALSEVFQTWGLPVIMQSDNGPPFQSVAFNTFWESKGINIRKAIPLSPQSNGAVERQNQGIIKALSASRLEGRNWRTALQDYVHRHNALIPHSRLGVTPFELMTGWKYRGFFPGLWQNSGRNRVDLTEVRERDAETKLSSKAYADSSRGAKDSKIAVGDVVLLAQQKKNKTDPNFSSERYRVIAREGPKVVVMSRTGVQYARNVRDVKAAPELQNDDDDVDEETLQYPENAELDLGGNSGVVEDMNPLRQQELPVPSETVSSSDPSETVRPTPRVLRKRDIIKRPSRYDDYVYHVFH